MRDDNERLRATLRRIQENAQAWHGPKIGTGHERALAVIAAWAAEALRRDS